MKTAPPYGHEEWYHIRTHEIDHRKFITVPSLLMLMQEASMQNVIKLKLSVWDLEEKQISWVLLRKEMKISRFPRLGEKIKVVTYPAGFDRVFAYRDFWVYGEQEDVLAKAASTWTLMNTSSRKLQRIPQEMLDLELPDADFRLPLPNSKLSGPDTYSDHYEYRIRHFDLDWNNHVNNVVLSKLMLQAAPEELFKNKILNNYIFHIKNECYPDENIRIEIAKKSNELHHRIVGSDNRIIAVGKSEWV